MQMKLEHDALVIINSSTINIVLAENSFRIYNMHVQWKNETPNLPSDAIDQPKKALEHNL